MNKIVINIILFQIGWFACVLSAANNHPLVGASISLFIIVSHVLLSGEYKQEIRIIVIAMVIGLSWIVLLFQQGGSLTNQECLMILSLRIGLS